MVLYTKIVLTYCEKKITRTIYSNSERSKQFLVREYFFNLFLEAGLIISNELEQLGFKLEKLLGLRNIQEKLEKEEILYCKIALYELYSNYIVILHKSLYCRSHTGILQK